MTAQELINKLLEFDREIEVQVLHFDKEWNEWEPKTIRDVFINGFHKVQLEAEY